MIGADTVDTFLALAAIPPFDRLAESELLLVASHARRRRYAPGDILLPGGLVAERLMVIIGGEALLDGSTAPPLFDAQSTLFGLPTPADYRAGPGGVDILSIARPHLFTIARECPDFIVGLGTIARTRPA